MRCGVNEARDQVRVRTNNRPEGNRTSAPWGAD